MKKPDFENGASELIGAIYDCAVDPALWTETMSRVISFCGGQAGCIGYRDVISGVVKWRTVNGVDPSYVSLHVDNLWQFDPVSGLLLHDPGSVVPINRLMPWEELVESRFYREWTIPQSFCDATHLVMEKSATEFTAVTVVTDDVKGRISEDINARLGFLGPHLNRAYKMSKLIALKDQEKSAFAQTIDRLAAGVLLVDAAGKIIHANPAGRQALLSGCLTSARGRLSATDPNANRALQETIDAAGKFSATGASTAISVAAASGERYVLHTLALSRATQPISGMPNAAVAAVFITPVEQQMRMIPEVIAATFRLTPMELRVLWGIAEIGGVREVADALGVGDATVKTHLSRIFAKTGVNRQSQLVRLVAGFASPLRNP